MNITWKIDQLERTLPDGTVVVAHWRVTATEDQYAAGAYGTCSFQRDENSPEFIPYEDLTEEIVLGWVWATGEAAAAAQPEGARGPRGGAGGVNKAQIEASLTAQIEAQKAPTKASGTPWGA